MLSAGRGGLIRVCGGWMIEARVNIDIVPLPEPIRVYFVSADSLYALMSPVWGINNSVIALTFALMDVRDVRVRMEYVEMAVVGFTIGKA